MKIDSQTLRLPSQAWKVKLVGEGADDAGGVFDDTMSEMCKEVTDSNLKLLIKTPNAKDEVGLHRDKYLLNADEMNHVKAQYFRFLGILIGVSIRTSKPIAINLAPIGIVTETFMWTMPEKSNQFLTDKRNKLPL